jgi:hypothetical protein
LRGNIEIRGLRHLTLAYSIVAILVRCTTTVRTTEGGFAGRDEIVVGDTKDESQTRTQNNPLEHD